MGRILKSQMSKRNKINSKQMANILSGKNGKWEWDGRYIKNYNNSNDKWEWDGRYIKNYSNSNNKWEWDGNYLKNYRNSNNKWEWDGRYLKNYNNSNEKIEIPSGAPVPVWAVVHGIVRVCL
ncbi:MAG: hypothetical protein D4R68_01260 [Ignavibacteriales bacterium]|nr:MAG: hypothetical protein D4R68_01260 [Ignavibacteriales bacterium]